MTGIVHPRPTRNVSRSAAHAGLPGAQADGSRGRRAADPEPATARKAHWWSVPWAPADGPRLAAAGLDLADLARHTAAADRARAIGWVAGLRTRGRRDPRTGQRSEGTDRSLRLSLCGRLVIARLTSPRGASIWTTRSAWCRDRACPLCQRARQRRLGAELRQWCSQRAERIYFVTLTQPKASLAEEGCKGAVDRILGTYRRAYGSGRASGRLVRLLWRGGIRSCETVIAAAGTLRRDGTTVALTGWHAHLHSLWELAPRPEGADLEAVADRLRRHALRRIAALGREPTSDSSSSRVRAWSVVAQWSVALEHHWAEVAIAVCRLAWLDACPGASAAAQDVQVADNKKIGQVTKYVTKPFELRPSYAREAFGALVDRRMLLAWGTWRSWRRELDDDDDDDGWTCEVSTTALGDLLRALSVTPDDGYLGEGHDGGITITWRDSEDRVDAATVWRQITSTPTPWLEREATERDALLREAERCALGALGYLDGDTPRTSARAPPRPIRRLLEQRERQWRDAAKDLVSARTRIRGSDGSAGHPTVSSARRSG